MTSGITPDGFAIRRNNTCNSALGEVDCGGTFSHWHACCATGAHCPPTSAKNYYNAFCCSQPGVNCTSEIIATGPYCSNATWSLYDNAGYFCCAPDRVGVDSNGSSACLPPGRDLLKGQKWLPAVAAKQKPSSADLSSFTDLPTLSPVTTDAPSSSNTGAIVGGVVGGVVALALIALALFFILRRRKAASQRQQQQILMQEQQQQQYLGANPHDSYYKTGYAAVPKEAPPSEIGGEQAPVELPAPDVRSPVELQGGETPRQQTVDRGLDAGVERDGGTRSTSPRT